MPIQEQLVAEITREVVARLRIQLQPQISSAASATHAAPSRDGVFATVDEAVDAAFEAQKKVAAMSFDDRKRMIDIIVRVCNDGAKSWAGWSLKRPKLAVSITRF